MTGSFRISQEMSIPLCKVAINGRLCTLYVPIVAVVQNSASQAAEHRFDDVEKL
jgi:hypothetical protein